jgi:hypothetical protein
MPLVADGSGEALMTGRELVRRAVLFEGPDRVPRDLPEPWGSDFLHVGPDEAPDWKPRVHGEDEWGCVWEKDAEGKTMGQVKVHPLPDYAMLAHFPFPNYDLPARYEQARKRIRENAEQKFVLAGIPLSLIHRLEYLRGHVEAWTDPYEFPKELGMLLDRMADIAVDSIGRYRLLRRLGIAGPADGVPDRIPRVFQTEIRACVRICARPGNAHVSAQLRPYR